MEKNYYIIQSRSFCFYIYYPMKDQMAFLSGYKLRDNLVFYMYLYIS